MARATTPTPMPTRRTAFGTAAGSSPPSTGQFFTRRVTLSGGGGGVCSSRPRPRAHTTNSDLAPSAVVVSHHGARGRCACSPTTHPGSFRCALHRGGPPAAAAARGATSTSGLHGHGAATRRSAMANSLVRIAAVEGGDHVRRALIRPSSHSQHRRSAFRPVPSRLSAMSAASASASSSSPQRVRGATQ